jgi:hypothetical protein
MTSIALGVFVLFIVYVMVWSIKNDQMRSISEQTGFIRMRDPARPEANVSDRSRRHPAAAIPRPRGDHHRR